MDLATGRVVRREPGLTAVDWWGFRDLSRRPAPGTGRACLFWGESGELIHLDPSTGERRVILQGAKAADRS